MFTAIRNYFNRRSLKRYFHECDRLLVEQYGLTGAQSFELLGRQNVIEFVAVAWEQGYPAHATATTIASSTEQERIARGAK